MAGVCDKVSAPDHQNLHRSRTTWSRGLRTIIFRLSMKRCGGRVGGAETAKMLKCDFREKRTQSNKIFGKKLRLASDRQQRLIDTYHYHLIIALLIAVVVNATAHFSQCWSVIREGVVAGSFDLGG